MEIIVTCLQSMVGRGKGRRHRVNKKNLKIMEKEVQCLLPSEQGAGRLLMASEYSVDKAPAARAVEELRH